MGARGMRGSAASLIADMRRPYKVTIFSSGVGPCPCQGCWCARRSSKLLHDWRMFAVVPTGCVIRSVLALNIVFDSPGELWRPERGMNSWDIVGGAHEKTI